MIENLTYKQFIQNIIDIRGQWNNDVRFSVRGCERHHIIPKCLGGTPEVLNWQYDENIIWLYPAEHFTAHELLAKENPNNISLTSAWWLMCNNNSNCNEKYIITSEQYEEAKNLSTHNIGVYNSENWWNKTIEERIDITYKQQQGRENKSEKEKEIWFKSIGKANKSRTAEQKQKTKIKKQNTWANKSADELKNSREKRRETFKNNPEIEINRKVKEKESKNNRTEEQKLESLNKLRQTLANTSDEEKQLRELKRQKTRHERGITFEGAQNPMAKAVICIETNQIFDTITEAAEFVGMKRCTFNLRLNKHKPDINGNNWRRLNDSE